MTNELEHAIARLERTLVHEGGILWREALFAGEAAEVVWPSDLPSLTNELKTWFGWRSTAVGYPTTESWRSAAWAAEQYRTHASNPSVEFPRSLVPVVDRYFVNVDDGAIWMWDFDEDGLDRFARTSFATLAELLASIEAGYAARRRSPWRRFRVDRPERAPWQRVDAVPDGEVFADAPIGSSWLVAPASGKWPKGAFMVKYAPAKWLQESVRVRVPFEDECIDDALTGLRYRFETGDETLDAELSDAAAAKSLGATMNRSSTKGPVELRHGVVRLWQQPTIHELVARLDRALQRSVPQVREALAAPARDSQLAALEADIGVAVPDDLRALWAFADGQTADRAFYWSYRLMSVADARRTLATMQRLADDQFGEAYWSPAFVPFLDRGNGDHVCVDATGAYGPPGSIVDFDHAWPERRQILFESVTDWLECFVDGLQTGIYVAARDGGVFPRDFVATGSFEEIRAHDRVRTNGRYPWERHLRLRAGSSSRS